MKPSNKPHRFCLAPMMDWSDTHCRTFWRMMTSNAFLYSEMVTTGALINGDSKRFLDFNPCEHPLALQLGGSNPKDLAICAKMAEDFGYDEVNLNCGCPSDRVQNNMIGACLMAEPELVAECIATMQNAVSIPVTVKHRIGIDHQDDYEDMKKFVSTIANTGCTTFIVHARKAWLKGLSPKENREIPPLDYNKVIQLKQEFPYLNIIINGGITTLEQSQHLLKNLDGVMIGREAYSNPYLLAEVDQQIFESKNPVRSRADIFLQFMDYCEEQLHKGTKLSHMTRHVLGLFQGQAGARHFRRVLSEKAPRTGAGMEVLQEAFAAIQSAKITDSDIMGD